jgi:hypothetical protein
MCLSSPSCLFNLDFESLNAMDKIRVYPVGALQICFIRALSSRNQTPNACTFSHELRTTTGVNVSDQTIRNHLRKTGLRSRRPAVHIPLTQRHMRLRLE